ncbi:hypothetical protein PM10SUCC1_31610 [Propionigenium maris DSM 9537]|uniref:Uncharacterized protein n=2 Tax=Propionigenium TaxID=2332 RepID=A0A9W6LPJ5_9FUSO|nr:hypothetical protein PM10SUCC1_31610 [Propionigenium maris DSM 9537]
MREMKKMLLLGMLVIGGLSYGRDFEYRESKELQVVQSVNSEDQSMISREREISKNNLEVYSEFHRDLDNLDRGHENR